MKRLSNTSHTVCLAPMMECTDRHFRYFVRCASRRTRLYTEMITTGAILHGDRQRLLEFDPAEQPLALQLGGSEPGALAACARVAVQLGYTEINLNAGCPSDRVQSGKFGACLLMEPRLVAECVDAIRSAAGVPVSVKTRIGVDERDSYAELAEFIGIVSEAGCSVFLIHARKAWLKGLSPKQNREVPPLRYDIVHRLKRDFPALTIVINGGIKHPDMIARQLEVVDGVMIGREAYSNPYLFAGIDQRFFGDNHPVLSRTELLEKYIPYMQIQLAKGVPLARMSRHLLGLFQGCPGARRWRRYISEHAHDTGADIGVIRAALAA